MGFRIHASVVRSPLPRSGCSCLFSFAFSWIFALIGLQCARRRVGTSSVVPVLALLVFASTAFSRATTWRVLQIYNDWQPVSVVVKAMRALSIGGDTTEPVLHALLWMVAWCDLCPLAINRYRRAA